MKRYPLLLAAPLVLTILSPACGGTVDASPESSAHASSDTTLVIEKGLNELGDTQRTEAVRDSFSVIKAKLGVSDPNDGDLTNIREATKNLKLRPEHVAAALSAGQTNLDAINETLAKQGFHPLSNLLPSGFFIVFGGGAGIGTSIGGGANVGVFVVIIPRQVERITQKPDGTIAYERYWRLKLSASGYIGPHLTVGVEAGTYARVGFGAIWLDMPDPSLFVGTYFGLSADVSFLPVSWDLKAGVLLNQGRLNVLGIAEWEGGPITKAALHAEGLRVISGQSIERKISALLGNVSDGPIHKDLLPETLLGN